jgi:hypothetical protein
VAPTLESPVFVDRDGGLWLSYEDYRKLERNVIALQAYAAELEEIVIYYEER